MEGTPAWRSLLRPPPGTAYSTSMSRGAWRVRIASPEMTAGALPGVASVCGHALRDLERFDLDLHWRPVEGRDEDRRRVAVPGKYHQHVERWRGVRKPLEPAVAVGNRRAGMPEDLDDGAGRRLPAFEEHAAGEGPRRRRPPEGRENRNRNAHLRHLPGA